MKPYNIAVVRRAGLNCDFYKLKRYLLSSLKAVKGKTPLRYNVAEVDDDELCWSVFVDATSPSPASVAPNSVHNG